MGKTIRRELNMELHNTVEDIVVARVNEAFEAIDAGNSTHKYCTCKQCRLDIICYALNRLQPHYIVSNRGVSRVQWETIERQQQIADITSLIHEGFRQVHHNQRPNFAHFPGESGAGGDKALPVFNIPVIMGRLFNGNNFAPISDVYVELLYNSELVIMKDANWQNPFRIVPNTEGAFSFWPVAVKADALDEPRVFEYTLRVAAPELETLNHFFKVPVTSEVQAASSFSLKRTFKLSYLYMFPPGEAEKNG